MLEIKNLSSVVGGCLCKCKYEEFAGNRQYNGGPMPTYVPKWVELGPRRDYGTCRSHCEDKYGRSLDSVWCQ